MDEAIYPFLQTVKYTDGVTEPSALPLYKDAKWNEAEGGAELDEYGEPIIVEGTEAIRGWIMRALRTRRYAEELHSWDYGSELGSLIGLPWERDTRLAEARRYLEECLLQNPYITSVSVGDVLFSGNTLTINCTVRTIYGDITLEGTNV